MSLRSRFKEFQDRFDQEIAERGGRNPDVEGLMESSATLGWVTPPHGIPAVSVEPILKESKPMFVDGAAEGWFEPLSIFGADKEQ